MNINGKMKKFTAVISACLILILSLVMAGCTSDSSDSQEYGEIKPIENEVSRTEIYTAYIDILEQNEDLIRNYNWQKEANDNFDTIFRQTSLCDINNDDVPELFFFASEGNYTAVLNIYTYMDGHAVKMDYSVDNRMDKGLFKDVAVSSGVQYVIYITSDSEHNKLSIYYNDAGGETQGYRLHEYEVNEEAVISQVNVLENEYGPNEDYTGTLDLFWQNGERISADEFAVGFEAALSSIDKVIMYSGYDDTSIWRRFETEDALSKSYDEMIEYLNDEI